MYEALQLELNRKVAIKLLHPRYVKSQKIIDRFHQEAKLAGSIEHDNICRVTDHGTDSSGAPYLVMPMLSGRSLKTMLEEGGLSQLRVIDIVCQTLSALEAAHREKIVHRDLKPDNIFITRMGDREDFVKLLDFGISKVLEKQSATALTSTGMVLGTAYYLAPEQARGSKNIDHRVDIFAMGVILYEALTGTRPFEGETYNEVVFKIAGEPIKVPRSINPSIFRSVEQVILKAMSIDPNERYASAEEMCAALEDAVVSGERPRFDAIADTLADTVADGGAVLPAGKASKRIAAGIVLGLAVAVGVTAAVLLGNSTSPVRTETEPSVGSSARHSDTPPGISPATVDRPAPESAPSAATAPVSSVDASSAGDSDTGTADEPTEKAAAATASNKAYDTDDGSKEVNHRHTPRPGARKSAKGRSGAKGKEGVIKGKFNTTFIFEED